MTDLGSPALVTPGTPGHGQRSGGRWEPVALRRAAIAEAVDGLLGSARADDDLRRVLLVHPQAGGGTGLAPGIEVSIETLAPGEDARPPRRNSSALSLQIQGTSDVVLDGRVWP
jgi:gentisate 1,2-dioxygenase